MTQSRMSCEPSSMRREILEIPDAASRLESARNQKSLKRAAAFAKAADPAVLITVARGSSDHAATYLAYAIQLALGLPVASTGPSISSVYGARLKAQRAVTLTISQSGASADLIAMTKMLGEEGAAQLVLTNRADGELAGLVEHAINVDAGPEHAVAATKSFVNSVLAGLWLVAHWSEDEILVASLRSLPDAFSRALTTTTPRLDALLDKTAPFTIAARGPAVGLAQEAALKAQEIFQRSATAFSGAELLHGPAAGMAYGHGVLVLSDQAETGMTQALDQLSKQDANLVRINRFVEPPEARHILTDCLPQLVAIYSAMERAAQRRGINPDAPQFLNKETITR